MYEIQTYSKVHTFSRCVRVYSLIFPVVPTSINKTSPFFFNNLPSLKTRRPHLERECFSVLKSCQASVSLLSLSSSPSLLFKALDCFFLVYRIFPSNIWRISQSTPFAAVRGSLPFAPSSSLHGYNFLYEHCHPISGILKK